MPITVLSNDEIVDRVMKRLNIEKDMHLAEYLGVSRQQIYQFRKLKGSQVSHRIISALLLSEPEFGIIGTQKPIKQTET